MVMIFLFIFAGLFIIGIVLMCDYGFEGPISRHLAYYSDNLKEISLAVCGIAIVGIFYCLIMCLSSNANKVKQDQWAEAKECGWGFYLDGQEVDPDNLDPNSYKITFDEENHKVLIASSSTSGYNKVSMGSKILMRSRLSK